MKKFRSLFSFLNLHIAGVALLLILNLVLGVRLFLAWSTLRAASADNRCTSSGCIKSGTAAACASSTAFDSGSPSASMAAQVSAALPTTRLSEMGIRHLK